MNHNQTIFDISFAGLWAFIVLFVSTIALALVYKVYLALIEETSLPKKETGNL